MTDQFSLKQAFAYCRSEVRRSDPDRFFSALFAPEPQRDHLLALYALNLELAQVWENVSEPVLGEMRFQWWQEALTTAESAQTDPHPVVRGLQSMRVSDHINEAELLRLVDGRRCDLEAGPTQDLQGVVAYAEQTGGLLCRLAASVLEDEDTSEIRQTATDIGTAWALLGLVRSVPFHTKRGKAFIPQSRAGGIDTAIVEAVVNEASDRLALARASQHRVPRRILPALLYVRLADGYIRQIRRAGYDPYALTPARWGPEKFLRLYWGALLGRF